jgi:hypothetical protein
MIAFVKVYLDDNMPEYMQGIIRCGSVISEDENGNELKDHQELIDNKEYHSREDLIEDIAKRLGVNPAIVEIID